MDDNELLELEQEVAVIQQQAYRRGVILLTKANRIPGIKFTTVKSDCPWCGGQNTYVFDAVASWNCQQCDFTPGADLYGGQYS